MRGARIAIWAAAAVVGGVAMTTALLRPPGAVVYLGGPVLTMDAANRVAEALAIDGDRIARIGGTAEMRAWGAQHGARIIDLQGRALLPAFIDAHGHFPGAGVLVVMVDLNSPPIGSVLRIDDIVQRMAQRAASKSGRDWVVGMGYDDTLLAEHRHPTRRDLDRASRERPLAIWHISGHLAVVNSAGLARLGIDRDRPDPEGGRYRRDPHSGEPDGVLEETATDPIAVELLAPSAWDSLRIVRRASQLYTAAGVATAQNGYASAAHMRGLTLLWRLGMLPLRVVLWPGRETQQALDQGEFAFTSPDPLWLRRGAVKLIADGSIQGYTGYLSQPYHIPPGHDSSYRGYARMPRLELAALVLRYHRQGLQIAVHGNGDAAIDDILDAFEAAQRALPRPDARHIIVHAQMARDDQLDRMAELGVIPSFFVLHTYYWGDRHRDRFMGPERAARMSPARSAERRGLRFTLHADTPVVPMEPLRIVWAAVNRRSTSGATIGPDQRISTQRALRAVTIDAAYQHFEEADKGSLEPGKLADLVLLDRSPLDDPQTIDRIRVLETVIGGRVVYRAPSAP